MATHTTWPAMEELHRAHEVGQRHLGRLSQALNDLDGGGAASAQAVNEAIAFFDTELARHLRYEEQALFPVLSRIIGRMGPIQVMLDEHQSLRQGLESFKKVWAQREAGEKKDAELQRLGTHIVWLLGSHIDKENNVLFPLAEEALQPALKVEVTERMKEETS